MQNVWAAVDTWYVVPWVSPFKRYHWVLELCLIVKLMKEMSGGKKMFKSETSNDKSKELVASYKLRTRDLMWDHYLNPIFALALQRCPGIKDKWQTTQSTSTPPSLLLSPSAPSKTKKMLNNRKKGATVPLDQPGWGVGRTCQCGGEWVGWRWSGVNLGAMLSHIQLTVEKRGDVLLFCILWFFTSTVASTPFSREQV